jgi:pyridoxal phosphate enzyme (YggS family)
MKRATIIPPPLAGGTPAERLATMHARLAAAAGKWGHPPPTLVAVSKTHAADAIVPFLHAGHRDFGENRVAEAAEKWPALRDEFNCRLHLIGQLQSNKADAAVALFDVIHSVDRPSLVAALAKAVSAAGRAPELFVQVGFDTAEGRGGCPVADLPALLDRCAGEGLAISGLMTVPPLGLDPAPYFALLAKLAARHALPARSMGMSNDAELAATLGATHVRVGSALFGAR